MKFHSKFEKELFYLLSGCAYHTDDRIKYEIPKVYEPDFIYRTKSNTIYIEAKGRFRTSEEARKYVHISKRLRQKEKLVFLFQNPNTPMPGSRRRKDGTRFTMEEWANRHGFKWYTIETVPKGWTK